jgi:hypothetical protein
MASAQSSEMIRMSSKPQRIVLWILGLLGLLIVSGVAMTRWKEQRTARSSAAAASCLCDTRFVEMCPARAPTGATPGAQASERRVVPARCDCPEEPDAEKLSAQGWTPCKAADAPP